MNFEDFIRDVMSCQEYQKALNNPNHPCYDIVHAYESHFMCEPFRIRDFSRINDVKVMFLGLSPGNPELEHKPYTPTKDALLEDVIKYIRKPISKGYHTNFKKTMIERIGNELEYVKANVVHGIGDKKSAMKCLETCGDKFLYDMIGLFWGLKYVIVYDFADRRVLNYVNKKLNISLGFQNYNAAKGISRNGITFIVAPRTRRYIRKLSKAQLHVTS